MAAGAAALLHADAAGREVELVVEHDHAVERDLQETHCFAHRLARFVHEGHRLQDQRALAAEMAFGHLAVEARAPRREDTAADDLVRRHESHIVPVPRIARPGIAEPDQQKHRTDGGSRLPLTSWPEPGPCRRPPVPQRHPPPEPQPPQALNPVTTEPHPQPPEPRDGSRRRCRCFGRRRGRRLAHHGRRGDRRHGGVLVAAHHAHALGNRERREMDRVADLEAGQVDLEILGDGGRLGAHGDLVQHDVQHAAALDAGRRRFVLEVDRHLHGDDRVGPDAQEVEMQRLVRHRIDLHVARQDVDGPCPRRRS